jgi:hypothetical protein
MADHENEERSLERILNELADSVLELADEAIIAECKAAGLDPDEEAARTRTVFCDAMQKLDNLNRRLSNLGHTVNSHSWQIEHGEYHNRCTACGSLVTFSSETGELKGRAASTSCPASTSYVFAEKRALNW